MQARETFAGKHTKRVLERKREVCKREREREEEGIVHCPVLCPVSCPLSCFMSTVLSHIKASISMCMSVVPHMHSHTPSCLLELLAAGCWLTIPPSMNRVLPLAFWPNIQLPVHCPRCGQTRPCGPQVGKKESKAQWPLRSRVTRCVLCMPLLAPHSLRFHMKHHRWQAMPNGGAFGGAFSKRGQRQHHQRGRHQRLRQSKWRDRQRGWHCQRLRQKGGITKGFAKEGNIAKGFAKAFVKGVR